MHTSNLKNSCKQTQKTGNPQKLTNEQTSNLKELFKTKTFVRLSPHSAPVPQKADTPTKPAKQHSIKTKKQNKTGKQARPKKRMERHKSLPSNKLTTTRTKATTDNTAKPKTKNLTIQNNKERKGWKTAQINNLTIIKPIKAFFQNRAYTNSNISITTNNAESHMTKTTANHFASLNKTKTQNLPTKQTITSIHRYKFHPIFNLKVVVVVTHK